MQAFIKQLIGLGETRVNTLLCCSFSLNQKFKTSLKWSNKAKHLWGEFTLGDAASDKLRFILPVGGVNVTLWI